MSAIYNPSPAFVQKAHVSGMAAYDALCLEAENDYQAYWARIAKEFITWKTPFTQVLDESNAPFFKRFAEGTLNPPYTALDRTAEKGLGSTTATNF